MKILGIDPGTTRVGYGLIETKGSAVKFIDCGLLKINSKNKEERLLELGESFEKLLKKVKPDLVGIEKLFFMKNIKTGIDVAQARGVLSYLAIKNKVLVVEIAPTEVKLNICGYGSADKKSVEKMVCRILGLKKIEGPDDVSDAIAIAIVAASNLKFKMANKI